jgi:hypothetical protein
MTANHFYPESRYVYPAEIIKKYPESEEVFFTQREKGIPPFSLIPLDISLISINDKLEIREFINENRKAGLTHLIVDDQLDRPIFFSELIKNEEKFPYLVKEYDSTSQGFGYKVKIFKIDYDKYDSIK